MATTTTKSKHVQFHHHIQNLCIHPWRTYETDTRSGQISGDIALALTACALPTASQHRKETNRDIRAKPRGAQINHQRKSRALVHTFADVIHLYIYMKLSQHDTAITTHAAVPQFRPLKKYVHTTGSCIMHSRRKTQRPPQMKRCRPAELFAPSFPMGPLVRWKLP